MSAFFCRDLLGSPKHFGINDVDNTRPPDRHVEPTALRIVPGNIWFSCDFYGPKLAARDEVENRHDPRITRNKRPAALGVEIESVRPPRPAGASTRALIPS